MLYHRKLWRVLAFTTLFLLPQVLPAAESQKGDSSKEDLLYGAYSDYYFFKKGLSFDREMALRESFLKWLYDGVVNEALIRRKEDPRQTLEALSPQELAEAGESVPLLPDNLDELTPNEQFFAITEFTKEEYNQKFVKARIIKDRLIKSSNSTQRERMFKADLHSALFTYIDRFYSDAILQFTELIQAYDYRNVEDVTFYRGECYFALQLYAKAEKDYLKVVEADADPWIRFKALSRLLTLAGDKGDIERLNHYWQLIETEFDSQKPAEYWDTAVIYARYQMAAGNLDAARASFDEIPATYFDWAQTQFFAAQCALMLMDLADSELRFSELTQEKHQDVLIPETIRNQSTLKLGYVYYLEGDYDLAFVNFTRIRKDPNLTESANIASAWCLYHLGIYAQAQQMVLEFKKDFPNSEFLYEAQALQGFCDELAGNDTLALNKYEGILKAMDDRQEYRDFIYERNEIIKVVAAMTELEPAMFDYGRRDLFPQYLALRKSLVDLTQKIRLAEGYKNSPQLMEIIAEQAKLFKTIDEQSNLENELYQREEGKLIEKLENVYADLMDLSDKISRGIRYELSKRNLIQREEMQRFTTTQLDTLGKHMNKEFTSLEQMLADVASQKKAAEEAGDQLVFAELTGLEVELHLLQSRLSSIESDIRANQPSEINSDLDLWSDFAYQRRQFGGLSFDEFYSRQNRVDQLDEYIQRVNQLLSARKQEELASGALTEDLVPASVPGEKEHCAPPMLLWQPHALTDEFNPRSSRAEPESPAVSAPENQPPTEESAIQAEPAVPVETPAESGESGVTPLEEGTGEESGTAPSEENSSEEAPPEPPSEEPESEEPNSEPQPSTNPDETPSTENGENPNQEDSIQQ